MENELIGTQTNYILVQVTLGEVETRKAVFYNDYNMSLTPTELPNATRFDTLEKVTAIANLQNQIAVLFGSKFEYVVIKEELVRTELVTEA